MAKTKVSDWDTTAANNTDVGNVGIAGSNSVRLGNDAIQEVMAQIAKVNGGTDAVSDTWAFADPSDGTKIVRLDAGNVTAGQTRVISAPDSDTTLLSTTAAQTLSAAAQGFARNNISAALKGHIHGLTLSNNSTDPTNDIDIAVGECASTETDPVLMVLASALTKRLDAAWAVGDGNGGLDTGSIANTWYHMFLIQRSDTGVVDALFSASATSPTMPTNYDRKRYIGSVQRIAGALKPFSQLGDEFLWTTPIGDINATNLGTAAVLYTLTGVPTGIQVTALLRVITTNAAINFIKISSPNETDTIDSTIGDITLQNPVAGINTAGHVQVRTDTLARFRARSNAASTTLRVATYGYVNRRGRDG